VSRPPGPPRSSRRGRVLLAVGLLALVLVAVALLPGARNLVGAALDADADAVRRQLLGLGPWARSS